MRIKEDFSEEAAVAFNIISLIDIVFFLLIFFLAATTFAEEERDRGITLPGSAAPLPMSAAPPTIIVNVESSGQLKIDNRLYTLAELKVKLGEVGRQNLKNRKAGEAETDLLIRCDKDTRHEFFANVLEAGHMAGFDKASIGYSKVEPKP